MYGHTYVARLVKGALENPQALNWAKWVWDKGVAREKWKELRPPKWFLPRKRKRIKNIVTRYACCATGTLTSRRVTTGFESSRRVSGGSSWHARKSLRLKCMGHPDSQRSAGLATNTIFSISFFEHLTHHWPDLNFTLNAASKLKVKSHYSKDQVTCDQVKQST